MIKYLRYILIIGWILPRKIIGLVLFFFALPFGRWANNTVFNYVLENDIYLPRLLERPISKLHRFTFKGKDIYGYRIDLYHHTKDGGYIKYKKVSKLQYYIAVFIWGWLDNDSNYYTTDLGFMEKVVIGRHFSWLPKIAKNQVQKEVDRLKVKGQYGNSFDLGD